MSVNGSELKRRKIGDLVRVLGDETRSLFRQEVELAKAEISEKVDAIRTDLEEVARQAGAGASQIGAAAARLAAAAVVGLVALGLLAALITVLLDGAMSLGGALALTFAVFALVAVVLVAAGRRRLKAATPLVMPWTLGAVKADIKHLVPDQTVETVKEDIEWVKHPTRSEER